MHKGEIMANVPEINITGRLTGLELSENSGIVNELLKIIATQASVINGLSAGDVKGVLDTSKGENVDITDLRKAVDENHKYEVKKFGEMKKLIDNIRAENGNVNSETLDAMQRTLTSLEEKVSALESNVNTMDMSRDSIDSQSKAIEKLSKQLSAIEKAISTPSPVRTSGNPTTQSVPTENPFENRSSEQSAEGQSTGNNTETNENEESKTPENIGDQGTARPPKHENIEEHIEDDHTQENKGEEGKKEDHTTTAVVPVGEVQDKTDRKNRKVKLVRKAMDEARLLSEPKLPWYKKVFNFANRHPVITTLVGAGIGLGITLLTGPVAYLLTPAMTFVDFVNRFANVLGAGAVVGLGGGVLASAVSGRVMSGKKGRLYNEFNKYYKKCASIEKTNESFETMINLAQEKAKAMDEKSKETKGILKGIKKYAYRKARNFNLKASRLGRVLKARNQTKLNENVEKALEVKLELNAKEATPNKRGKTKTMAIAGYMQKKQKLDNKRALGKISDEEYAVRLEDLDYDASQLKGGEAGLSHVNNNHRTFDKEAYELINAVKGNKSATMQNVLNDIESRQGVWEEYEEKLINQAEAKRDAEILKKAGRTSEAKMIEDIARAQAQKIEEYKRVTGKEPEITEIEIDNDHSNQM